MYVTHNWGRISALQGIEIIVDANAAKTIWTAKLNVGDKGMGGYGRCSYKRTTQEKRCSKNLRRSLTVSARENMSSEKVSPITEVVSEQGVAKKPSSSASGITGLLW